MELVRRMAWPGDASPRFNARVAGALTLLVIVTGAIAEGVISDRLIGRDLSRVLPNVVAHPDQVQLAFALYMVEMACGVAELALFYLLIRPVSQSLALVAACLGLMANIVKTTGRLFFVAPLFVVAPSPLAQALSPEASATLTYVFLRLTDRAAVMGLVFFGFAGVVKGYLVLRSTFLPRVFGVLGMIAGVGLLMWLSQPLAHRYANTILALGALGALALALWLLIVGVDETRWREQAGRSST